MWRNLFGLRRGAAQAAQRKASVPDGVVVYAIGDIHGQDHLLTSLLGHIHADASLQDCERRILVFVGDYVDRGPASRAVIDRVAAGSPTFETVALKGNHEQMLLDFLADPEFWDVYRRLGGTETLMSYGVARDLIVAPGVAPATIRDTFLSVFPQAHHDFLRSLSLSYDCGDYHFVHAGVRPGVPLHLQTEEDQLWIRDEFLTAGDVFGGRVIVHGHTPKRDPENLGFRVGIDTGAYMTGRLTAARLRGADVNFLHSSW
ncbi:MAG: serine/threonine protein phosphatase [Steroidobacteraceae bacterium]|nr:serine/threonine protein phosphatase [Steroidobacteraceae bacterium]